MATQSGMRSVRRMLREDGSWQHQQARTMDREGIRRPSRLGDPARPAVCHFETAMTRSK
jgi:hypothetical protein